MWEGSIQELISCDLDNKFRQRESHTRMRASFEVFVVRCDEIRSESARPFFGKERLTAAQTVEGARGMSGQTEERREAKARSFRPEQAMKLHGRL